MKRKAEDDDTNISIQSPAEFPYLLNFNGVRPTEDTKFTAFKPQSNGAINRKTQNHRIVQGESSRMEFYGDNFSVAEMMAPCKYLVGVIDEETHQLHVADARVLYMRQTIKALKSLKTSSNSMENQNAATVKRSLGETFGTRRAKQAIRSYDRGQIDVSTLANVTSHIEGAIDEKAINIPTPATIEKEANTSRPLPPFNDKTSIVEEIYSYDDLVPPQEVKALPTKSVLEFKKEDFASLKASGKQPIYVLERLDLAVQRLDSKQVQSLIYLSYLIRFRSMTEFQLNRDKMVKDLLNDAPEVTIQRLYDLFTEQHPGNDQGSVRYKVPAPLKDKLTAYICALCLHIDSFAVPVNILAKDLQLTPTKTMDYFKQMGCSVESTSVNGVSMRRARLTAPLTFPKPPRRRMK